MRVYKQGYQAGLAKDDWCPHVPGTKEWEHWWEGYWSGVDERKSKSLLELDKEDVEYQKRKQSR